MKKNDEYRIDKIKILETVLILGALYFFIAAIAHFFGLTLFPFYEGKLYTIYHDTLIALASVIIAGVLFTMTMHPKGKKDIVNFIIIGGVIGIIANIFILMRVDFEALGASDKRIQTIVEMVLLIIFVVLLLILKPKKENRKKYG